MPNQTTNYGLKKPLANEYIDIGLQNENMDKIDAVLAPTADPAQVPTGLTGKLSQWVSWITNRIKAITGGANWYDAPATTLQAAKTQMDNTQSSLNTHLADYVRQPGYALTTGTSSIYTVTLNPTPGPLQDGFAIAIRIHVNNTGACYLNVNGLGNIPIKKANGNDLGAGTLKAGSIYTLRYNYNNGNFILQGEGGSGNAVASDLLSGKTASTDAGDIVGTMPSNGSQTATITTQGGTKVIPAGYTPGGTVTASFLNLSAANIRSGVNIGGVVGTLVQGKKTASGEFTGTGGTTMTVSGLDFTPNEIMFSARYSNTSEWVMYENGYYNCGSLMSGSPPERGYGYFTVARYSGNFSNSYPYRWFASE